MQTKFKWNSKQRLILIAGIALGVTLTPNIETAHILGEDIYVFANGEADFINGDERIQNKLKTVFQMQQLLGTNNLYERMLQLEKEDDQDSFAA